MSSLKNKNKILGLNTTFSDACRFPEVPTFCDLFATACGSGASVFTFEARRDLHNYPNRNGESFRVIPLAWKKSFEWDRHPGRSKMRATFATLVP
jgi:hypothetical protein